MKKIIFLSLSLMIVSMFGQFKYGFGISADMGSTVIGVEGVKIEPGVSLTIPLKFSGKFKVEPEISIVGYNQMNDSTSVYKSIIMPSICVSYDMVTPSKNTIISPGIKFGLIKATLEEEMWGKYVYTQVPGFFIAAVLGGEYFFSENMSFGGDFQLRFESLSETKDAGNEFDYTQVNTKSSIKLRFYFN
ncbi:MAG: hypothetical protein KAS62_06970 [Candidatus Delongbacteria bacterium]|nr:hypothetical protein [Candidatus Delongbacteria bacterium]